MQSFRSIWLWAGTNFFQLSMWPSVHSFLTHTFESYPDYNGVILIIMFPVSCLLCIVEPICIYLIINYKLSVSNVIIAYLPTLTLLNLHLNKSLQLTYKLTYIASKSKSPVGICAAVIFLARKDQMIIFSTMVFVLNGTIWITETKTLRTKTIIKMY